MPANANSDSTTPTHAGGAVYKVDNGAEFYLLVRPRSGKNEWVLPKGHIQNGEDENDAALREVQEETGVVARVIVPVATVTFNAGGNAVRITFFLMEMISQGEATESRETGWYRYGDALRMLTHRESKEVLEVAEQKRLTLRNRESK